MQMFVLTINKKTSLSALFVKINGFYENRELNTYLFVYVIVYPPRIRYNISNAQVIKLLRSEDVLTYEFIRYFHSYKYIIG